jgi:C4-dicarboxylate-specific signal transduction histidine kinase
MYAVDKEMIGKVALSVISALMSALLTFVFAVQNQREQFALQLAELSTLIGNLSVKIEERTDDRYRARDASRDFSKVDVQIRANAIHIQELQELVRQHAQDRGVHN